MNPFRKISDAYLRLRHSKGYGVHSPFAYDLVTTAVNPGSGYGWYGYYDIDAALLKEGQGEYPRLRRDAMLLLRLLSFLGSKRLLLFPPKVKALKAAAEGAGIPCVEIHGARHIPAPQPGDLFAVRGDFSADEIRRRLDAGTPVMAIDPSPAVRNAVDGFSAPGLLLKGTRILVAIPNPDMAFVCYTVRM